MKAKLKSGKVVKGKLAEIFVNKGIATEISEDEKESTPKEKKPRKPREKKPKSKQENKE